MLTAKDAWLATLGQLEIQLNRATFETWLKGSKLLAYEDGEFVIQVRHAYAKDWLEKHLNHQIVETLGKVFGRTVRVNYVVWLPTHTLQAQPGTLFASTSTQPATESFTTPQQTGGTQTSLDLNASVSSEPDYSEWDPRVNPILFDAVSTSPPEQETAYEPQLDRRYTFESFVTGPCNQFAYAAARAVADKPASPYNPLFIYGGVGLGKTHLLNAIGHASRDAGKRVIYVTAEAFTNELVTAIRAKTTDQLRDHYRRADLLLVDDVQFLAGKTSSEEEFYHTFNAVISQGGQVVVACNQHPRALDKLDERLRSRFAGGLLADIQPPEMETRLAILHAKSGAQGVTLPADVASLLARQPSDNVRELEGLLTQVIARTILTGEPLSLALAEHVLHKTVPGSTPRRITNLEQILKAAASYHQLSMDDLLSKRRTKEVVRARQIAMYLAREETDASYPQIGAAMGGRNHTTVLHGYQKIAGEVKADDSLRHEVETIRRQLYLFSQD
jgi:chromosomal replication initiator protein